VAAEDSRLEPVLSLGLADLFWFTRAEPAARF